MKNANFIYEKYPTEIVFLERNKKKILIKIEQVQSTMRLIKLKSINQNCFILNISNIFLKKNTLF